ncbi:MAG: phosphatidylserine/phosphatidylglycerophosphate/cardiolipin synthase family protein [Actinomycetota bacterium]|nr:phosphatidylserine/phosphatidylglycerophosphate/cardiolipin synthase family protein [Actinomycetota bacterium]
MDRLKTVALRALLAGLGTQAAVIAGLILMDAVKKHSRTRRKGFPHPGVFKSRVADSDTTIYTSGQDLYDDMLAAIRGAKHQIFLETFIWKGDRTGQMFKEALTEAVDRGVEVFVIYDGFANLVVPPWFYRFDSRIQVFRFPVIRPSLLLRTVRSTGLDHRKLLVVDGDIGFIGGYNIGSLYATEWRDTHLKVVGPSAGDLHRAFLVVWNDRLGQRRPAIQETGADFWQPSMRPINNVPSHLVYPIRGIYLDAINRARDHIYITTAYFIPDQQILTALFKASRRGVDVRVILPEDSNHVLSDWLSRGFYSSLLAEGVTILLYRNAMIHAKTATIDGQWVTVGTANIDRLSLTGNYESNLEIYSTDLASDMEEIFAVDSANSRLLTIEEWRGRPLLARFSELVLIPLRPFL